MLYGEINRQRLKIINEHVVADTIDYLEARFAFSADWDGLEKWVHFAKDGEVYDIRLTDNCVRKEDHLNLSAGIWKVYLHGNEFSGGKVIERITTNAAILKVEPTGTLDGEPFPEMPASVTEQILARLEDVEQNGVGGGTPGTVSIVPHIGENGNWFVGETDTGVKAQGEPGQPGADGSPGADGQPGQDGTSVTVSSVSESDADGGSNVVTFSDGKTLTVKNGKTGTPGAPGESGADGKSAYQIWLEAGNTGTEADFLEAIKGADGSPGQDGQPGSDGADGITPHIGENGNWFVGETDTGVKAQGEDGEPGYTPQKGVDYWTEADKAEMVNDVLAAMPTWEGGSY